MIANQSLLSKMPLLTDKSVRDCMETEVTSNEIFYSNSSFQSKNAFTKDTLLQHLYFKSGLYLSSDNADTFAKISI
jgi:hypothetical protein